MEYLLIAFKFYYNFTGDTGYDDGIVEPKGEIHSFRLTILPIGNYEKRWYMEKQHMNPEDAVKVHKLLASKLSLGMHYATFKEHPEQNIDDHEKDLEGAILKYLLSRN
ncbi:MBL fold metallo-hydrolase [Alkaliphilus transvaalensis]|uniref:MBL fold metallo-hydrolase n=1 Tax=Alkaliphilus transvaalensis TaxID=114628 RepID=UPI00047934E5|nr:MBL fold metallo-hydrolase [Alkaliphilus transvaalensis]